MIYGIDISHHNGVVDFKKVKDKGVKFVILRCGYASISNRNNLRKDKNFELYYKKAKENGLSIGVYFYSRCNSNSLAIKEAKYIISLLKNKEIDYPVWLDVEDIKTLKSVSRETITNSILTCLSEIQKHGYYTGVYTGKYILKDYLIENKLAKFDKWIAEWNKTCSYKGSYGMWQFGGETNKLKSVKVEGVSSKCCDQNYSLIDYSKLIKSKGLNGLSIKKIKGRTTSNLNVRTGRGINNKIIKTLKKNTLVEVTNIKDEWGFVEEHNGYVCMRYVK